MEEEPPFDGFHVRGRWQELGHRCVEGVHHWKQVYLILSVFLSKKTLPTKQRCDGDRNAGLEVLVLEVDGDLCDGQDEEGGDVGGHQLVHRVPFQPAHFTNEEKA